MTSKFESWVRTFGIKRLTRELCDGGTGLCITQSAIYGWVARRHAPRGHRISQLVQVSRGELTVDDVRRHFEQRQLR